MIAFLMKNYSLVPPKTKKGLGKEQNKSNARLSLDGEVGALSVGIHKVKKNETQYVHAVG